MTRAVIGWRPDRVSDARVRAYSPAIEAYRPGDVVWTSRHGSAVLARIIGVHSRRDGLFFRAQIETEAGLWSRTWAPVTLGMIRQGYSAARILDAV